MKYTYKPIVFYLFTILGSWAAWFAAAYFSYQKMGYRELELLMLGLFSPAIVSLYLSYNSNNDLLIQDFKSRFAFKKINRKSYPVIFLLLPSLLLLAIGLSNLFGQSTIGIQLSSDFSVLQNNIFFGFLLLLLIPILEEMGWRGYGVDSLKQSYNLFNTSLIFAFLWGIWHLPLLFINHWNTNIVYLMNFFLVIFPISFIINWVYYRNNRSIIAAIILHFYLDLIEVILKNELFTSCLFTFLLFIVSIYILVKNKKFFFTTVESGLLYQKIH